MKWETKEDFIVWLQEQRYDAMIKSGFNANDISFDMLNSSINIDLFEKIDFDEILELLNNIYKDDHLQIFYLQYFFIHYEEYLYFKKSKVREKADIFKKDIEEIKAQADRIQSLTSRDLPAVRLPKRPEEIVYGFVTRWRDFGIKDEIIDEFCRPFGYKIKEINRSAKDEIKFFKESTMKDRPRYKMLENSENPTAAWDSLIYYRPKHTS